MTQSREPEIIEPDDDTDDELRELQGDAPPIWQGIEQRPDLRGRLVRGTVAALKVYLCVMLVANLVLVCWTVFSRAALGVGTPWSQEVSQLLLAALVFPGSALALLKGEHRAFKVVVDRMSETWRRRVELWVVLVIAAFGVALLVGAVLWFDHQSASPATLLGTPIPASIQSVPLMLGAALVVAFCALIVSCQPRRDAVWATGGLLAFAVLVIVITQLTGGISNLQSAFSVWFVVLLVLLVLGVPVGFGFGIVTIGLVIGTQFSVPLDGVARRLFDSSSDFVLTAVPFFIAAGLLMEAGELTHRIVAFARSVVGHFRGGLGQVMVASMYFMSGVSGSEAADVAAVGSVMRRPMRKAGFSGGETTGILVAASVMGSTVPPSIGLIVIASATGLSVGTLFVAGIMPAAVLAVVLAVVIYVRARMLRLQPSKRASVKTMAVAFKGALFGIGLPIIVIGGLLGGFGTPTELSAVAVIYVLVVEALVHRGLSWKKVARVGVASATMTGMLLFIISTASGLVYVATFARIPQSLGEFLVDISGSNALLFLVLTVMALIPLGMLTEGLPALLIFPPLFLPVALELGIDPIHYAMLMFLAVYVGAELPPLGAGYYFAASVLRVPIRAGMKPAYAYLGVIVVGILIIALVPATVTWVPSLLGL